MSSTRASDATLSAGRKILSGLSVLSVMLVLYGSWLPFRFDAAAWSAHGISVLARVAWSPSGLEDVLVNILIYIPIGLFVSIRFALAGLSRRTQVILTMSLAFLISASSESLQTLIASRVASYTDMSFNGFGAIIGLLVAPTAMYLMLRLLGRVSDALRSRQMAVLFWLFLSLVVLAKLIPFDFVLSGDEFHHALSAARWSPFAPPAVASENLLEDMVESAGGFFAFVLLGMLGALAKREVGEPRTAAAVNTIAGLIFLAAGIEAAQLFIRAHVCDAADMLTHVWGAALGAVLGATVLGDRMSGQSARTGNPAVRMLLVMAIVVQCALIAGHAFPENASLSMPSLEAVQWIPFNAHFMMPFARGISRIVASLMWYATLATLAVAWLQARGARRDFVTAAAITVAVVTITEALQIFSPHSYPDATEPLLALLASLTAIAAFKWVNRVLSRGFQPTVHPQKRGELVRL